jgi:hypothetical protein
MGDYLLHAGMGVITVPFLDLGLQIGGSKLQSLKW